MILKQVGLKNQAAVVCLLLLAISGFSGCGSRGKNANEPVVQEAAIYAVNTTTAAHGRIRDHFALSGDIIAASTVDAFSDAAGRVSRLFVSVGSRVQRGDPIAEVDPSRPGMEFVPSVVNAPVAGTIVALPAQLGMTITQAVPLARIAAGNGLEIRLFVAERFISKVALGQLCEIVLNAWPGEVFTGRIIELSPTLDQLARTMEIRVRVENPGTRLMAGMFAQVRIIVQQRDGAVQIPASAMITRFGEQFIFIVDNSEPDAPIVRRRDIVPGIVIDGVMEVLQGLSGDEEVVLRGQSIIHDGARVNVVDRTPPVNTY
ncbi:MAG: efflux RND transporter periplasmic adaptor subunit [Treponema sp.]|nr:efflux RND transporter periplasmic adaptor subunit [Treponema sp.]